VVHFIPAKRCVELLESLTRVFDLLCKRVT
jgi:hypothetical protein